MEFTAVSPYNVAARVSLPDKITIYDSTLRDGEQMPGISFTPEQKIEIATKLSELGVPQIEAGFPAASDQDMRAIKMITDLGLKSEILCLSRTMSEDIDAAADCEVDLILMFIGTSDLHMQYKLKMTPEEVLKRIETSLDYAHARGLKVSFSSEDSTRSNLKFLVDAYHAAERSGACRLGITDTVGCANPEAIHYLVKKVRENTKTPLSVHLHNDFGFALANSISSLEAGAEAITTTIGGIGERAGNVPLEQLVMALKHLYKRDLGIKTEGFRALTTLVFDSMNMTIPSNQPWVGLNPFSHESGIHVAAILNNPMTYECVNPEQVGNKRRLFLGKHSGTALVKSRLAERKVIADQEQICDIVRAVKRAGEDHGRVSDEEFWSIVKRVVELNLKDPASKNPSK
jgi:methanogen homocitrate synthase